MGELKKDIFKYAKSLKPVSQISAGLKWSELMEKFSDFSLPERLPGDLGFVLRVVDALAFLGEVDSLILDPKWPEMFTVSMSLSFVKQLRFDRKNLKKRLDEIVEGLEASAREWVRNLEGADVAAWGEESVAHLRTDYRPFLSSVLISLLQERASELPEGWAEATITELKGIVARLPGDPAKAVEGDHPILRMVLTYDTFPTAKDESQAGEVKLNAGFPGGRPVVYGLDTLLNGVDGTTANGLNYKLVHELNTVRQIGETAGSCDPGQGATAASLVRTKAEADARQDSSKIAREDAPGSELRPLANPHGYGLAQMLRGPAPTLSGYGFLAGDAALNPATGFTLENHRELLEEFEGGSKAAGSAGRTVSTPFGIYEEKRLAKEQTVTTRKVAGVYSREKERSKGAQKNAKEANLLAKKAAAAGASALMRERHHEFSMLATSRKGRGLPGGASSRGMETALTAMLQAVRVEKSIEKSLRSGTFGPAEAVEFSLGGASGESTSLKLACQLGGRPF